MFEVMTDADVPAVVALMNRAYRGGGANAGWCTEAAYITGDRTTAALVRADMSEKPHGAYLKWVNGASGQIVGCVWLEPVADGMWYLGSLATDPDQQKSGMGTTMLRAAETWIAAHGGRRVRMSVVNVRDTLIAWYLRRGYYLTGETGPFPYGDDRFGTPLRDDLAFVILEKALAPGG